MKRVLLKLRSYVVNKFSVAKILASSFLFMIIMGTLLLSLPISNNREVLPLIDNLFTATSATCVTGLLTTVALEQYSVFGRFVILILIQFGGLGLMSFISIVLMFIKTKLEFKERMLMKDALNKMDFSDLRHYIYGIFKFTFFFEILGALIMSPVLIAEYDFLGGIAQSIFLSVSAFCNAGIDCFGATSLMAYQNNPIIVFTMTALIITGGLGFAVWFDYKEKLGLLVRFKKNVYKKLNIHTKLVTAITVSLILFGMVFIFVAEYNNSMASLSLPSKIMNSFFNSVTLRTAGFYTIDYSVLNRITKVFMCIFMLIGGSPGGTAGGIKTTTFFLLIIMTISDIRNEKHMHVYGKHILKKNFIKAYVVFIFYLASIILAFMTLLVSENFDALDLLFEIVSAIGTVGLSTGLTPLLSGFGKVVIIVLMFIGRVGPITIAYSLRKSTRNDTGIRYPQTEIMVG